VIARARSTTLCADQYRAGRADCAGASDLPSTQPLALSLRRGGRARLLLALLLLPGPPFPFAGLGPQLRLLPLLLLPRRPLAPSRVLRRPLLRRALLPPRRRLLAPSPRVVRLGPPGRNRLLASSQSARGRAVGLSAPKAPAAAKPPINTRRSRL
jgi:hypothetical protein